MRVTSVHCHNNGFKTGGYSPVHRRGLVNEPQEGEPHDVIKPRNVLCRTKWKVYQNAIYWINLKSAEKTGSAFWQNHSNAIISDNSVLADCLESVVRTKSEEIQYQTTHFSPRLPPKVILKSAWQARLQDHDQRGTSAGQLAAHEETMKPEIESSSQGLLRVEVEQEEEKTVRNS